MTILEYSSSFKFAGANTEFSSSKLSRFETQALKEKYLSVMGSELMESSLRVKSELLKSSRNNFSKQDLLVLNSLNFLPTNVRRPELFSNFLDFFTKFRVNETTRRLVTANKSVILPDMPLVKAHITSTDVIHS